MINKELQTRAMLAVDLVAHKYETFSINELYSDWQTKIVVEAELSKWYATITPMEKADGTLWFVNITCDDIKDMDANQVSEISYLLNTASEIAKQIEEWI